MPAMDFKNLKKKIREPKVSRLLPNVCDFQKQSNTLGYGFKNLLKIYSQAYGFLFFVISISVLTVASRAYKEIVFHLIKDKKHLAAFTLCE